MARTLIISLALLALTACQLAPAPTPTPEVRPPTRVPAAIATSAADATALVASGPTVTALPLPGGTRPPAATPTVATEALPSPGSSEAAGPPARPENCALLPWVRGLPGLRLGAQLSLAPDLDVQIARAAGLQASWVSLPVVWAAVEPSKGQYDFAGLDTAIDLAAESGLRPLLVVRDTPAWAAGEDLLPREPADLARFLGALAARYQGRAAAYQIWELPNKASGGRKAATAERYAEALLAGAPALRAADPCALVLAGGLLPTRANDPAVALDDLAYYQRLAAYDDGAVRATYDGLAVWLLTGNSAPGEHSKEQDERYRRFTYLERLRNELVFQGDADKQLWVTLGWALSPGGDELESVDADEQADYTLKALERTRERHPWVATLFVRGLSAQPPAPGEADYRIVDEMGRTRPAFDALAGRRVEPGQPNPRSGFEGNEALGLLWAYRKVGDPAPGAALAPDGSLRVATGGQWTYSIDANGAFRWSYRLGGQQGTVGLAVGPDGTTYIGSDASLLVAVKPDSNTLWDALLPEPPSQAPTVAGGRLYQPLVGSLAALDAADGTLLWQLPLGAKPGQASVGQDGTIYLGTTDGRLHAISPDGQPRWAFDTGKWARGAPLVRADGSIIVATDAGSVFALGPDGAERWRFAGTGALAATAAQGEDGTLYVPSSEGLLYALGPDGTLRWQAQLPGAAVLAPAVGTNGTIVVASGNTLSALDPSGALRWRFQAEERLAVAPQLGVPGMVLSADEEGTLYGLGLLTMRDRLGWDR
jgi:outer membrane protein assembly factor BamB